MVDHSLSGAMQGLDVLLFYTLSWGEGDIRLTRDREDRFRVVAVVLLPPHKGLHILRTDQPDLMPKRLKLARPVKCPLQAGRSYSD